MRWLAASLAFALAACSSLYDYESTSGYVVQSGDTLYSIAWRHGLDPRELAAWNGISDPNRINVGQRLSLSPGSAGAVAASRPATPAARPLPQSAAPAPRWQWPADGQLVARYGDQGGLTSGIGISSGMGSSVMAAADGRVVYAGSGMVDYGQLIIIAHNDTWLSAYGYNRRLLVAEGETVRRGQQIAEMGPGPGQVPRLHFEIRQNGEPVDPLPLLPGVGPS